MSCWQISLDVRQIVAVSENAFGLGFQWAARRTATAEVAEACRGNGRHWDMINNLVDPLLRSEHDLQAYFRQQSHHTRLVRFGDNEQNKFCRKGR
jgi:hypothetical protein